MIIGEITWGGEEHGQSEILQGLAPSPQRTLQGLQATVIVISSE